MKEAELHFRLNETDKKEILRYCEKNNMSLSEFLREISKEKIGSKTKEQFLIERKLISEINAIGININQIARGVNTNGGGESDLLKTQEYQKKLINLVQKYIDNM